MAKLEGVKTLDMVNGEITKIEYNGEVYERVDTPQKGDIGLFSEDSWVSTAEGGAVFTEIIDVDDAGDPRVSYELGSKWYSEYLTYFRKPSAPSLKAGDTIRMIENCPAGGYSTGDTFEVIAVDSEYLIFVDNDGDIRHVSVENGTRYELVPKKQRELFAKVNRPNNTPIPGDYVTFKLHEDMYYVTEGKKYKVVDEDGELKFKDDDGDFISIVFEEIRTIDEIFVKYTKEQAEQKAKKGDKILVVDAKSTGGNYGNGDILTVSTSKSAGVYVEEFARGLWDEEFIVLTPEQAGEDIPNSEEPPKISVKPGDYVINGMGSLGRVDRIEGEWFYGEWLYNEDHPGSFPIGMATANAIKRLATPEEIAKYEEYKAGKEAKKCTQEIEVGDLVRVIDSPGALPEGSVFKVTDVDGYGNIRGRRENSDEYDYYYAPHHVELVAKAEDVYV